MAAKNPKFIRRLKKRVLEQYPKPAKLWFRTTVLVLAFIVMSFVFANNSVEIKPEYAPKQPRGEVSKELNELITKEHAIAVEEIKTSLQQMDTWYHYRFILIGGVIAVFLGHIGVWGRQNSTSYRASERVLESVLMSNRTGAMLTLICIVAFVIDMHIRTNINGIQHLGRWITYYVEPTYLKAASRDPVKALAETGFIPWEMFLRLPENAGSRIYPITFSVQLHFMTMVSYILYLLVFQNVSLLSRRGRQQQVAAIGFILVHVCLLAFIIVAHTVRDTFNVWCFPMVSLEDCSLSGSQGPTYYLIAWVALIALNLPYFYRLFPSLRANVKN